MPFRPYLLENSNLFERFFAETNGFFFGIQPRSPNSLSRLLTVLSEIFKFKFKFLLIDFAVERGFCQKLFGTFSVYNLVFFFSCFSRFRISRNFFCCFFQLKIFKYSYVLWIKLYQLSNKIYR